MKEKLKWLYDLFSTPAFRIIICLVAIICGLAIVSSIIATNFVDVPEDHWAYSYIYQAGKDKIMEGTGKNKFEPDKTLSLAEFTAILVRAFYPEELAASKAGEYPWYAKAMDVAAKHDLLRLVIDRNPQNNVSRYDMAAMINALLADYGLPELSEDQVYETRMRIPDRFSSIFMPDFDVVIPAYFYGILTGVDSAGTFNAFGTVDRAQAAAIYVRMRQLVDEKGNGSGHTPITTPAPVQTLAPGLPDGTEGDTRFMFLPGETTVNQMMARINAATPPYREGYLTNGKPITEANIQEMLAEIEKTMPAGSVWDATSKYNYSSTKWGAAYGAGSAGGGCNSFAACVSDAIFGEDAPIYRHQDFDQVKAGDVQWKRTSSSLQDGHVRVFMSDPNEEGYVYYCDGGKTVSWHLVFQTAVNNPDAHKYTEVYTRYKP